MPVVDECIKDNLFQTPIEFVAQETLNLGLLMHPLFQDDIHEVSDFEDFRLQAQQIIPSLRQNDHYKLEENNEKEIVLHPYENLDVFSVELCEGLSSETPFLNDMDVSLKFLQECTGLK